MPAKWLYETSNSSSQKSRCRTQLRLRDIFDVFVCEHIEDDRLRDKLSCPTYVVADFNIAI
uniref:Bm11101 n=1 Tax=Brugia malayi TaxID=6279 RepID=A0A0J9Y3Q0_BRUMA|nr:Bm11101 [Brugia malayi]